tara:strand:- start:9370 stop:10227 length:858 start_codon:yes stop_codon:yes gene_type:complete
MIQRDVIAGIPCVVYLPDPFLVDSRLPLISLFRASPDEWFQSRQDHSRGKRNVFTVVNELINQDYLLPCGLIFPQTCNQAMTEYYFSSKLHKQNLCEEPPEVILDVNHFTDYFLPELATKYPVDIDRVSLDGFSLGGYTSLSYSFAEPDRFVSTGSFDGAILDYNFDNKRVNPHTPSDLTFDVFPYLFGSDPDEDLFRGQNALDLVTKKDTDIPKNLHIMYTNDNGVTSNKPRVQSFIECMKERGLQNSAELEVIHDNSLHEWYWVDEYLFRCLPFHSRMLKDAS